jgi:hypothetical protein
MGVLSFVQIGVKETVLSSNFLLFQSCFLIDNREENKARSSFLRNDCFVFCVLQQGKMINSVWFSAEQYILFTWEKIQFKYNAEGRILSDMKLLHFWHWKTSYSQNVAPYTLANQTFSSQLEYVSQSHGINNIIISHVIANRQLKQ